MGKAEDPTTVWTAREKMCKLNDRRGIPLMQVQHEYIHYSFSFLTSVFSKHL